MASAMVGTTLVLDWRVVVETVLVDKTSMDVASRVVARMGRLARLVVVETVLGLEDRLSSHRRMVAHVVVASVDCAQARVVGAMGMVAWMVVAPDMGRTNIMAPRLGLGLELVLAARMVLELVCLALE